jgi:hypothetical protein
MPFSVAAGATAHAAGRIRILGNLKTHDLFFLLEFYGGWLDFV